MKLTIEIPNIEDRTAEELFDDIASVGSEIIADKDNGTASTNGESVLKGAGGEVLVIYRYEA